MAANDKVLRYSKQLGMLSVLKEKNLISEEEYSVYLAKLQRDYAKVLR